MPVCRVNVNRRLLRLQKHIDKQLVDEIIHVRRHRQ